MLQTKTKIFSIHLAARPAGKVSRFIIKRNGYCLYSENKIHGRDSFCVVFCSIMTYLTKVSGTDFKSATLHLYYQTIS